MDSRVYALALILAASCAAPDVSHDPAARLSSLPGVRDVKAELPRSVRPSRPFVTMAHDDPRLVSLRAKYDLAKVVAPARDSWTAQLLLKDWVHRAIPDGTPRVKPSHAVEILDAAAKGETFWCTYFAIAYLECAFALGWPCRKVAVDRDHGAEGMESSHHGIVEVWSDAFCKWAVIDPQSNLHFEKRGVPLSAWEIRAEWLKNQGADVDHVVGAPPATLRKNPAIRWWNKPEDETSAYFWVYVIDHADMRNPAARYLFPQDASNAGKTWYQNDSAAKRSRKHVAYERNQFVPVASDELNWTDGVVEVTVVEAESGRVRLSLDSYCPGRSHFEASVNGAAWSRVEDERSFLWTLAPGENSLKVRAVRGGGTRGPTSSLSLKMTK